MSDPSNGHPRDLLSEYLDDELGLEERASVDRHLAGCEDCRTELETLRRLARALAEESVPPVPVDLEARIGRRLDAGTLVRLSRWRFALPATIAATLGAVGLLVALQWPHDAGHVVPTAPAPPPESKQRAIDEAKPAFAPPPPVLEEHGEASAPRENTDARADALKKDLPVTPEVTPMRDAESARPAAPAAPAGVAGGVIGGVVGGVEGGSKGGSEGDVATGAREKVAAQLSAADARREPAAAKSETASVCVERWLDSGLRARWDVQDVTTAVWELNRMARDVGGIGVWHGVAEGGPYLLAVPRARFEEVFFALRARGIAGLAEPPALADGVDCVGISIELGAPR